MATITLTTDWNKSDYYLGALKGKILSNDINTRLVDISHQVQPFNILQAAFIIRNCCFSFPQGTLHMIVVNAALSAKVNLLFFEISGQTFITSDNGIVGLISGQLPDVVYKVKGISQRMNFDSLDVFVETAFNLIAKKPLHEFSEKADRYESQIPYRPVIDKNLINGSVIYVDSFSNAITNISRDTFDKVGGGRSFEIYIQSNHYKIDHLNNTYSDSVSGELLAFFNSLNLLEIAINHGNAAELLNLTVSSVIRIKFYNEKPENKLTLTGA